MSASRPINLGRNHWKLREMTRSPGLVARSRPINLGRNHWKLATCPVCGGEDWVAPLTWGGIIGNLARPPVADKAPNPNVAPLTWGGIIGNFVNVLEWVLHRELSRPINLGRNHWKPPKQAIGRIGFKGNLVAPLTWGGIIGNFLGKDPDPSGTRVAPLTWGGIIGNFWGVRAALKLSRGSPH